MPKKQDITPEQLRLIAAELRAAAEVIESAVDDLVREDVEVIEIGVGTALTRAEQLGGFSRTVQREAQKRLSVVRADRVKFRPVNRDKSD